MTQPTALFSRRTAIKGALGLAAATLAAPNLPAFTATASPLLKYPLRMVYGRIGPEGFERITTEEQNAWIALQVRLGGIIQTMEPIQSYSLLTVRPPAEDGGESSVITARRIATDAGADHALLYSTNDGRKSFPAFSNWLSRAYTHLRSELTPRDNAIGEAHIIHASGGLPAISVSADAKPKSILNPLDHFRDPENEALELMITQLERRFHDEARALIASHRSIAD